MTARAPEWLKTTGREVVSRASCIVSALTWERSTMTPRAFIRATTSRPKGVSPPCTRSSVAESAQPVFSLCVRVMYRTPRPAKAARWSRESAMQCPPSIPVSAAWCPRDQIAVTSAAVRASSISG